ncbi:MAG: glutamate-cysteine ligase family protein [Desulfuromonadales bacterium]
MSRSRGLGLFAGFGVELEYMIVDRDSLAILPVADLVLHQVAGEMANEVECGALRWSNELVLHVLELKTNGPAPHLVGLADEFTRQGRQINQLLEAFNGMLMPGAMHPWMDPDLETRLWPHGDRAIYAAYDRIFGCRGHGWSNLQSAHLNLPFAGDEEFGRLHAAIRLVLPLLPALAAASPVVNGRVTGLLDNRIEMYRVNQARIPSITGQVIPEPAFTIDAYQTMILETLYRDIAPHDPAGILQEEWLNSRGAIARFDRHAIEIRLLDVQESPLADLAIITLLVEVLRELVAETCTPWTEQQLWSENALAEIFHAVLQEGRGALIKDPRYLAMFGIQADVLSVGELWRVLAARLLTGSDEAWAPLQVILDEGPLARRIIDALGPEPDRDRLAAVYRELCDCLQEGSMYHA